MNIESQRLLLSSEHDGENGNVSERYDQEEKQRSYGATSSITITRKEGAYKPIGLSWHNLTVVHPKSGRVILDNISGMADPGQLLALMGASGAGKTTLLNTLLFRNLKNLFMDGKVLVNGHDLGKSITYVSGYVQQDELFMGTLTVNEHLLVQAHLRLVGYSDRQIKKRVNEVIDELGLQSCRNTRIGISGVRKGISGGEARRLLFAAELLSNPQIIFADEPTTGLDSSMAESVISLMQKLAKSGRTVICTIHQPSSAIYAKFDKVMFLVGGRLAYFGEPIRVVELLNRFGYPCPTNYNPADAMIQYLSVELNKEDECQQRIQRICNGWDHSAEGHQFYEEVAKRKKAVKERPERRNKKRAHYLVQTSSLFYRSALDNWRNKGLTRTKLITKLLIGIFIGLLYWQTQLTPIGISNLNGAMFYIIAELTYSTLFGIVAYMPNDFPLLVREYHDGLYNSGAYYVARAASYVPLFAVDGIVLVTTAYWMIGLVPSLYRFLIACGIAILVEQSAAAFGVMLSTISPSYPVAISIAGPILTVLSLTGGLFANVGELPGFISWAQYLSWFRYGFEAFAISQWEGALEGDSTARCSNQTNCLPSARTVLNKFSFDPDMFYFDLGAMLLFIMGCYLIGYIGLLVRVRRAR